MTRTVLVSVGDPTIPWASLEPTADRKRVIRLNDGSVEELGTATEHIRLFDEADRQVIERTQILDSTALGNRVDTTVVVRDSFAPLRYRSMRGIETVEAIYEGPHARTRRIRHGVVSDTHDMELAQDAFDAHTVELVLRLLPVHEGFRASIPVFDPNTCARFDAVVEVLGSDELDDGAGRITPSWRVGLHLQNHRQRYWLSMAGMDLVQQSVPMEDGSIIAFVR